MRKLFASVLVVSSVACFSQQAEPLLPDTIIAEMTIEGTRATSKAPVSSTTLNEAEIKSLNTGQDIPYLLRFTPSLVSTSDAGNGIGYTGLWIRGSDPSRINVTINGVPLNDPESQQVFWVNTPDLAGNTSSIQVQRGIGTSANGAGSFGGSIKLETFGVKGKPYAEVINGIGSFNTRRHSIGFGTGLLHERFTLEAKLANIQSDGYIDRAQSDLKSYYTEGCYFGNKTTVRLMAFGGRENTYQSWYGTPWEVLHGTTEDKIAFAERNGLTEAQQQNLLTSGRTYNFYQYANQVDNYGQDHYQLHLSHVPTNKLRINISGHYTHGQGYFEEFKEDEGYEDYGLENPVGDSTLGIYTTDLVRRRWLKNDFYGGVFSLVYINNKLQSVLGGALNQYDGNHFGEITWMEYAGNTFIGDHYYDGKSMKRDGNVYWRNIYTINKMIDLYADLQLRQVDYKTKGVDNDLRAYDITDQLVFFNPKAGINYRPSKPSRIYGSVAMASKEPNRNDYIDAPDFTKVKPEQMMDGEAGYQWTTSNLNYGINLYYMNYKDQLVLTGELNDVGAPVRMNVPESYRRGIELDAAYKMKTGLLLSGNLTLSQNKIKTFSETLYDYTVDYDVISVQHEDTDISFSPAIIAAFRAEYKFGRETSTRIAKGNGEFSIGLQNKYVGKQFLDNTQNDDLAIDPYFITDVVVGYDYIHPSGYGFNISCAVNNVLDMTYSSNGYTYSYIYGERITETFYYPQAGRNFMINLALKI